VLLLGDIAEPNSRQLPLDADKLARYFLVLFGNERNLNPSNYCCEKQFSARVNIRFQKKDYTSSLTFKFSLINSHNPHSQQ
jgi:hypothetical protein